MRPVRTTYAVVLAAVAVAAGVRLLVTPYLGELFPFITFFVAVIFCAWYGGLWPAMTAAVLGILVAWYCFVPARFSWTIKDPGQELAMVLTLFLSLVVALFSESARLARLGAEAAAAEARDRAETLRTTFDSIGDAVITTDAAGAVTGMNRVAEALTGWPEEEALGRPLTDVFQVLDEVTRLPRPSPARVVLEEGGAYEQRHALLVTRDGRELAVDKSAAPIRDAGGPVIGVVLVFHDVTQRRGQQRLLEQRERQLQLITDHLPVLIAHCDTALRFKFVNKPYADRFGIQPADVIGRQIADVVGPEAFASFAERVHEVLAGTPVLFEQEIPYDTGPQFMRVAYTPERDANGVVVGLVAAIDNITDRRRAEEALREADRRKDEFLATLAHELRNPLAPIRNAVEILRLSDDYAVTGPARALLERQLEQLVRLVDDLLDISRISRGRIELCQERTDLAAVVRTAVETSRPLIDAAGHTLSVHLPPAPVVVQGDPLRLAQVISNLLTNAAKYTPDGGRIDLTLAADGDAAVLRVADTGIGIPAEMLGRIFEIFAQVGKSLERSQGGLGIGLSLVRQLVQMHGGSVNATSDGPGCGSTFEVRLPRLAEAAPAPAAAKPAGKAPKRRVLVVDDNRDAALTLAMMLRLMKHEVRMACDGVEALEMIAADPPEVVILDLGMPRLNGYETCQRLRADPATRDLYLIALTGWGQDDDRAKTQAAGFDAHLVKPAEPAAVDQLLANLPRTI